MSDLSRALVPYIEPPRTRTPRAEHNVESEVQSNQLQQLPIPQSPRRQQRRSRRDNLSSPQRQRPIELSVIVSCVAHQPFSIYLSTRGLAMDRNGFNSYNAPQNNYTGYSGAHHGHGQGQGHGNYPQQHQFGQNQYPGAAAAAGQQNPGGNANGSINHYHGSAFNFFFLKSGAYDLNFRAPGLTPGTSDSPSLPYNQQPPQPIHQMANNGLGYGHSSQGNSQGQGYGTGMCHHNNSMQQHPMNQCHSGGPVGYPPSFPNHYGNGNRHGSIPMASSNGHGLNYGHNEALEPLRRSLSTSTLLSDEFPPEDHMFLSQNYQKRI